MPLPRQRRLRRLKARSRSTELSGAPYRARRFPLSLSRMTEEFLLQETLAAAEWTCFVFYRGTW